MTILSLANYLTYVEIKVKGYKPRLGWNINFEYQGHKFKGTVVEVGQTVLVKV